MPPVDKGAGDTDPSEYDDDEGDGVDLEWRSATPERMASIPNLRLHIVCLFVVICLFHFGDLMVDW